MIQRSKQTKKITMNKRTEKIKTSFRLALAFYLFTVVSLFQACSDENQINKASGSSEFEAYSDDIDVDSNFEDIEDLSTAAMDYDFNATGGRSERDARFDCATLTESTDGNVRVITIDFGDGCEGPNGRVRKGKIVISISGDHREIGATHTTELVNFYIDELHIEGKSVKTNISESVDSAPKFSIALTNGKITWSDGSYATREAEHTRTIYKSNDSSDDEMLLEGTVSGVNKESVQYQVDIIEPLVFKRSCMGKIPVSGTKGYTVNDELATIDFGDGACDNLATVTKDGVITEIEIKFRRRRK